MHALLQLVVDVLAMHLQHGAQGSGGARAGLTVAFGGFLLQLRQGFGHGLHGFLAHLRIDGLGLGGRAGLGLGGHCGGFGRQAARHAQLVGPHGHGRQRRVGILSGAAAWATAGWKASQTSSSWEREASSSGGKRASTLGQAASPVSASACSCQRPTSARSTSSAPAHRARAWWREPRCAGPAARRPRAAPAHGAAGLRWS